MTTVTMGTSYKSTFAYDGLSRLRTRQEYTWMGSGWYPGESVRYIYDGMNVVQERTSANTPTVAYTRGQDLSGNLQGAGGIGGMLARSHGYSSGTWSTHSFYHADGMGNITYMANSAQAMVAKYKYDPYGRTISQSGTLSGANLYRFSSKEVNLTGGIYYYGYRFYHPQLQRWLNRDPYADDASVAYLNVPGSEPKEWTLGELQAVLDGSPFEQRDGPNVHSFCFNNPAGLVDPWGLDCWDDFEECMSPKAICLAATGGILGALGTAAGGFQGAGPHRTPTGKDKALVRGGKITKYGKGLVRSIGGGGVGGAAVGVLALSTKCYAELLGCLSAGSGVAPPRPPYEPPYSGGPVNAPVAIHDSGDSTSWD